MSENTDFLEHEDFVFLQGCLLATDLQFCSSLLLTSWCPLVSLDFAEAATKGVSTVCEGMTLTGWCGLKVGLLLRRADFHRIAIRLLAGTPRSPLNTPPLF